MPSSGFDCAPKVALGGASKPQCTSQEALQHAKEDRYRRLLARELPKSAVRLQRAWRARQDRARAKEHLRAIWAQRYASIAALQDAYVPPEEMVMSVLPLLLALHLPPPGPLRTSLQQGASLDPLSPQDASCLRGGLYLVLRSLTAVPPSRCFLALGAVPHHQPALVSQLRRLATLCCAVIGQNHHDSDGLTESAAGRILALLTSFLSNSPGLEVVAAHFKVWLGGLPMVAHAARRLVCELEDEKAATESPANEQKLAILTAGAGNVVLAQVNLLSGGAIRCNGHTNGNHGTGGSAVALQNLVQLDLTAPGAVDCLSANGQALLQGAFCGVARCAEAASGKMDSVSSLYLLAALATLLVPVKSKSGHHPLPSAEAAAAFAPAAQALLDSAGNAAKFSFSADGFGTTTAALATAVQVISAREVADTLFTVLPHEQFAQMSVKLLLLTEANGTMSSCGVRLLSTLAFGMPRFLPALWHWLARVVRMPLEVPSEASRWEIPTLHQGINSVPALAVGPFALFCQVYVHYLSVADDFEFHEGKGPFTLSHQRAITATLTTLVFRTHIPIKKPAVKNGKSAAAVSPLQLAALGKTAPRLLRALYERDTRRRFCSPELWLEPYRRMSASQGAEATGASVLYALMRNRGDGEETSNSNSPSAAATSPTGGVGRTSPNKGNSPSSVAAGLAALLLQAPQCIPFEERVAVFRGLIEMDKHS